MEDPILTNEIAPALPDLGGPKDLAERLLEKRRLLAGSSAAALVFGDLTELELLKILRLAFEVSFKKDEGRYPRLTIVVPTRMETHLHESAQVSFRPPAPVTPRTVKRLAAAVPPRPHGLIVKATADGLRCTGIGRFETAGALLREDQTGLYAGSEGLVVEINGPGDLTVHEGGQVFTLRAGRIQRQFDGNEAVKRLAHFEWLRDEVVTLTLGEVNERVQGKVAAAVRDAWLLVLKDTVELAHGGAFAVLPTDAKSFDDLPDHWQSQIDIAYPTSAPDLLRPLGHYVTAHWGAHRGVSRGESLQMLMDTADGISRLSATDGFVLLNRSLRVLGFGAKIGWDESIPPTCPEVDDLLEPTGGEFGLLRAGTRHTAAYRLAAVVGGTYVFIVSQDGDLRVFFPDGEGGVLVTAPLEPVTLLFQGM